MKTTNKRKHKARSGKEQDSTPNRKEKITFLFHEAASGTSLVLDSMVYAYICLYLKYKHIMYVYRHIGTLVSDLHFQKLQPSVAPLKSTATITWLHEKLTWITRFRRNSNWWLNVLWITQIG